MAIILFHFLCFTKQDRLKLGCLLPFWRFSGAPQIPEGSKTPPAIADDPNSRIEANAGVEAATRGRAEEDNGPGQLSM